MKRWLLVLGLAVPLAAVDYTTCQSVNGHWWRAASFQTRQAYLAGFRDSVQAAAVPTADWWEEVSLVAASKSISQFYEDDQNLAIPLPGAIIIARMKHRQASQSAIDEKLARLRDFPSTCRQELPRESL